MKTVFVLFDSLNRHMLGPYGGTRIPTPNFDRLAERCCHLRPPLCRQHAVHPGAARHADRAPVVPAQELGADGAVRQRLSRAALSRPASTATWSPTTIIIGRMAAPPITTATTPTSSCAARKATPGRRWCSRPGSGCARCTTSASSTRRSAPIRARTWSIANSSARNPIFPPFRSSPAAWSSSSRTATPTTGSCRSRPSIRTSRSTPRRASRSRSRPAGTARSATGRATAASTSCRPNARS